MHLIDHIFQGLFLITYPELKWNFKSKLLLSFFAFYMHVLKIEHFKVFLHNELSSIISYDISPLYQCLLMVKISTFLNTKNNAFFWLFSYYLAINHKPQAFCGSQRRNKSLGDHLYYLQKGTCTWE